MSNSRIISREQIDHDQRQLVLMLRKLLLYKHDMASLRDIGVVLKDMGWLLHEDDEAWKKEVEYQASRVWGVYERLSWDPPYNEPAEITLEEKIDIEDAIHMLIALVKSKIIEAP